MVELSHSEISQEVRRLKREQRTSEISQRIRELNRAKKKFQCFSGYACTVNTVTGACQIVGVPFAVGEDEAWPTSLGVMFFVRNKYDQKILWFHPACGRGQAYLVNCAKAEDLVEHSPGVGDACIIVARRRRDIEMCLMARGVTPPPR